MTCFSIAVFMQFEVEPQYKTKKSLFNAFGFESYKIYDTMNHDEYFYKLFCVGSSTRIFDNNLWLHNKKFQFLSSLRVTQRRMYYTNSGTPVSPLILNSTNNIWAKSRGIKPYDKTDKNIEDGDSTKQEISFLGRGGKTDLPAREALKSRSLEDFQNFLNDHNNTESIITALTYDMVLANYENAYICSVILTTEIDQVGLNKKKLTIYIHNRKIYSGGWAVFRIIVEIAFVVFFVAHLFVFIFQLVYMTKRMYFTIKMRKKETEPSKKIIALKLIFTDGFCISQILTFIFGLVSIGLWCAYVGYVYPKFKEIDFSYIGRTTLGYELQNRLVVGGQILETYRSFAIITFLFMFVRLVKIFARNVKTARIFLKTIQYSFSDIVSFFIFFVCLLLGFTLFTWIYYGRWFVRFNTLWSSLLQNFQFSMGIIKSDLFLEMFEEAEVMTVFYFLLLIIIIRFIVIKIILAIMMHFFKIATDELNQNRFRPFHVHKEVPSTGLTTLFFTYSTIMNGLCDIVCFKCGSNNQNKEQEPKADKFFGGFTKWKIQQIDCPEIEIHKKGEISDSSKSNMNENDNKKKKEEMVPVSLSRPKPNRNQDEKREKFYDLNYEEDYEFTIRNAFFDSEKDSEKVKKYYERKYRRNLVRSLLFIFFIIVFIVMFLFTILSPWRANMFSYLGKILNYDEINIFEEKSLDTIKKFIKNSMDYFEEYNNQADSSPPNTTKYIFYGNNFLLGDKILVTVRRQQLNETFNNFEFPVRKAEVLDLFDLYYEDKSVVSLNGEQFIWETEHTYHKYGGYPYVIKLKSTNLDNLLRFINESVSYVCVEFFLKNYEYASGFYIKIIFKLDYGGYFETRFNTYFLKYKLVQSPLDIVKYVFEVIFVISYFIYIYDFIKTLIDENAVYDKWYRDVIAPQNLKVKNMRNQIEPEPLRKLKYLWSVSKCIDLVIIFMCIGIIYTRIVLWVKEIDFRNMLEENKIGDGEENIYNLRDIFYEGATAKNNYEIVGSIIIFLACVKLISLLKLSKFFSLLIQTLEDSKNNIITFVVIIILIQPCFVFYSHLAFGHVDKEYSKVESSILSCIKVFFGYIDFKQLQTDNNVFGPIFFLVYLIVVNLLLLNLFVSIIYTSYLKIKRQIMRRTETWEIKSLICCCKKKRKNVSDNQLMIEAEFDYEKKMKKFDSKLLISKEKCGLEEWIKNENDQIKILNDTLFAIKKKRNDVELAYESTKIGKEYLFEDNLYKNIQPNHLSCFNVQYLNSMVIINEQLEKDIINIHEAIDHLDKHKKFMDYDELLENIKVKNDLVRAKIKEIDSKFTEMYSDLNEMYSKKNVEKMEEEKEDEKKKEKEEASEEKVILAKPEVLKGKTIQEEDSFVENDE